MSMYQAVGLSRKKIRGIAKKIREIFNITEYSFPIVEFIDLVLPQLDEEFSLSVVEPSELPPGHYAVTYPDKHEMLIRRDVYDNAALGDGRSRFTLCHELFHYLFHTSENISFARADEKLPPYIDPEWQANTFAAELMIPFDLVKGMNEDEIIKKCNVSRQCAKIQMRYYKSVY